MQSFYPKAPTGSAGELIIEIISVFYNESYSSVKIRWDFFHAVVESVHGCTTWALTICMEKKRDGNYMRMLHVLNKSWKQYITRNKLYGH